MRIVLFCLHYYPVPMAALLNTGTCQLSGSSHRPLASPGLQVLPNAPFQLYPTRLLGRPTYLGHWVAARNQEKRGDQYAWDPTMLSSVTL